MDQPDYEGGATKESGLTICPNRGATECPSDEKINEAEKVLKTKGRQTEQL